MGPDAIKATRSIMGPSRPFVFWDKNLTGLPHLPSKDMIFQLANQISIYIYINYCPYFFGLASFFTLDDTLHSVRYRCGNGM